MAVPAKKITSFEDEFNRRYGSIKTVNREVKLRKDGSPKKTHPNNVEGRSTWVDPIKEVDDIEKILEYINMRIETENREDYKWQWERNKLYFFMAVFSGFRVCDLVGARPGTKYKKKDKDGNIYYEYPEWTGLKWNDVFEKDGVTFKDEIVVKELKTSHDGKIRMRRVPLAEETKECICGYVNKYNPDTKSSDYIFLNRQKERLSAKTIEKFIKEVTEECDVKGNFSTHSFRKTCAYNMYMGMVDNIGEKMALEETMRFTGHRSLQAFLSYLGIQKDDNKKRVSALSNRLSTATKGKI